MSAPPGTSSPLTLLALATEKLTSALLGGTGADLRTGALAELPSANAQALLEVLSQGLRDEHAGLAPPIEVLRLFYGGSLDRLEQTGATDDWAGEALGYGIRRLHSLALPCARLSDFGVGQVVAALPGLRELTISGCRKLTPASVARLGLLPSLERLEISECGLSLDGAAVTPLLALPQLSALDLGGNELRADGVLALCEPSGGAALRKLRLCGSAVNEECCLALMGRSLEALDLRMCGVTVESAQCVALAMGGTLLSLALGDALLEDAVSTCVPSLSALRSLTLSGATLSRADVAAIAMLPALTELELSSCRLCACACSLRRTLSALPSLRRLCLDLSSTDDAQREGCSDASAEGARLASMLAGQFSISVAGEPGDEEIETDADADADADADGSGTHNLHGAHDLHGGHGARDGSDASGAEAAFWSDSDRTSGGQLSGGARLISLSAAGAGSLLSGIVSWAAPAAGSATELRLGGFADAARLLGAAASAAVSLGEASSPRLVHLRTLDMSGTRSDDSALALLGDACPRLASLDASRNAAITDAGVRCLLPLRGSLTSLNLAHLPALSAHSLPAIAQLGLLRSLALDATGITPDQQEAALGSRARLERTKLAAAHATETLRAAQRRGADAPPGEAGVKRYSAAEMTALRGSPFARAPARLGGLPMAARAQPVPTRTERRFDASPLERPRLSAAARSRRASPR